MFKSNIAIRKRFVSDYNLPIPIVDDEDMFMYFLNLYEDDFHSLTLYGEMVEEINEKFGGNIDAFLDNYYSVRENIIQTIENGSAFQAFNTMDMNQFSIKDKIQVSSNNIYNANNNMDFFISIDLKKANFQALNKVDRNILLNSDTYEDFIHKFTDSQYIANSKYFRQCIFGEMNPKRHITVERYYTYQIYKRIIDNIPYLSDHCVSLCNDEIVFKYNDGYYNMEKCDFLRDKIEKIAKEIGFNVDVEFFQLKSYAIHSVRNGVEHFFYIKDFCCTDGKFKMFTLPMRYHAIAYKLYKNMKLDDMDYFFEDDGHIVKICDKFTLNKIETFTINNHN